MVQIWKHGAREEPEPEPEAQGRTVTVLKLTEGLGLIEACIRVT